LRPRGTLTAPAARGLLQRITMAYFFDRVACGAGRHNSENVCKIELLASAGGAEVTLNRSISLARRAIYEQLMDQWRSETQKPLKS
jgi:hypothetical protein